jgi:phosphoribosyl 1,2-cyclic phosphate phosphodiesterase
MALELLFLGTGTSAGVPMIGCECAVCTSDDPRDRRSRPSVVVRYTDDGGTQRQYLVDTTPELRSQIIAARIHRIDGVLFTHNHADHIFGLDDLRRFNAVMKTPLDIYAEPRVLEWLRGTFGYIFEAHKNVNQTFVASLIPHAIGPAPEGGPLQLPVAGGATWTPLRLMHGRLPIAGFRVDFQGASVAYCTDVSSIPPQTYPLLENLDVLVIDALRYRHHPTHMTVDQALGEVERIGPRRAYFTHIAHDIRHAELQPKLPPNVHLAYDGLSVVSESAGTAAVDPAAKARGA